MYDMRTPESPNSIRRSSSHGTTRPAQRINTEPSVVASTVPGNRQASPCSGSDAVASAFGTISPPPSAPPATKPSAFGSSTPMPWSSSSSPRSRNDVIRPPRSGLIDISHGAPLHILSGSDRSLERDASGRPRCFHVRTGRLRAYGDLTDATIAKSFPKPDPRNPDLQPLAGAGAITRLLDRDGEPQLQPGDRQPVRVTAGRALRGRNGLSRRLSSQLAQLSGTDVRQHMGHR